MTTIKKFFADESGQGMVEYGLIIALVAVGCIVALTTLGSGITGKLGSITTALGGAGN